MNLFLRIIATLVITQGYFQEAKIFIAPGVNQIYQLMGSGFSQRL